jgi:hypothetical protein
MGPIDAWPAQAARHFSWADGGSRRSSPETAELAFPAPLEIDIRGEDRAIYLGTLRLHRDEFHTLLKVEVLDHYSTAQMECASASARKRPCARPC